MNPRGALMLTALICASGAVPASAGTHRLYDGITAFVPNPDGKDFTVTVEVQDLNIFENGPREVLFKVYDPDGKTVVREVIPDDGVTSPAYTQPAAAWDHEAWYYAWCQMQGTAPMVRWSAWSAADRLATVPKRTFARPIKGGKKGVYRVLLMGAVDHYATLKIDQALAHGVAGNTEWLHGHGDQFRRSFIYVPRGTRGVHVALIEHDRPRTRRFTLRAPDGKTLFEGTATGAFSRAPVLFDQLGQYDDQLLSLEVSAGAGDFMVALALLRDVAEGKTFRGDPAVAAVLAPDEATARATRNGAIYHDGQVFWQPFQVRFHDWLKTLKAEDFAIDPAKLPQEPGFIPLNGPYMRPPLSDTIMHHWPAHKNRQALNLALRDLSVGLNHIGPGDHPAVGPFRNLGYEFSNYAFHYWRPAWRILRQSDAPGEVKEIIRDAFLLCGDRLAFSRGWARVNGNSFAQVISALRYCQEATGDPMQKEQFEIYFDRFLYGGWGDRVGVGPSGPVQESFGYAYHYGSYILTTWKSLLADFPEERFQKMYDRIRTWYSYTLAEENIAAGPWSARTSYYPHWQIEREGAFAWKGLPGPDFTVSVNDGNEWFAARRKGYYALTYHGRLAPTWSHNAHPGTTGYGGGMLCQLHVPGKGPVLASTLNGSYGEGMDPSLWRTFHIHALVGQTADGKPLVAADAEHLDARLEGSTVTSSGDVRGTSLGTSRSYTFGDDGIACAVRLKESEYDPLLSLWLKNNLRGKVADAYEMIPFVKHKAGKAASKNPEDATSVTALAADGQALGPLTAEAVQAKTVVIDRGGFGVRIELDEPRPVQRGVANTVLIRLAEKATPASQVGLQYRLVPFGAP